jgi:hypothetical protein
VPRDEAKMTFFSSWWDTPFIVVVAMDPLQCAF